MKLGKFDAKHLAGYGVAVIAMLLVGWLLLGTVSQKGFAVPNDLTSLTKSAQDAGASYKAPADIQAACVPAGKVTDSMKSDVKLVTGKDAVTCTYRDDARHTDALWGVAFGVLVAVVAIALLAAFAVGESKKVHPGALVSSVIGAIVLTALLWAPVHSWVRHGKLDGAIFWRGFVVTLIVLVGGWIVHEIHRRQDERAALPSVDAERPSAVRGIAL